MTKQDDDPMFGLVRMTEHGAHDVIVKWSEMTDEERAQAWSEYEKAYGPGARTESRQ